MKVAILIAMLACACGGRETVASKSAAAFDEAQRKGIPVAAPQPAAAVTDTGHAAMPAMPDMPDMDHEAMDHSKMPGMDHSKMPGMDHSNMPGMDHSNMPGMDHSNMPGMDHSSMPGMDHSKMPGMQHGTSTPAPIVIAPPVTNSSIEQTRPATTLRGDEFDAPAPSSVDEAAKAKQGMHHHGSAQ